MNNVNNSTGEVFESAPNFEVTPLSPSLRSYRCNPVKKTGIDCSNQFRDQYIEVPPYAHDESGKVLNKTNSPVLVKDKPLDVQGFIDSFFESSSLQQNIKRVQSQGGNPLSLVGDGSGILFADFSDMPDNIHDWAPYLDEKNVEYEKLLKQKDEELANIKKANDEALARQKNEQEAHLNDLVKTAVLNALKGDNK